MIIAGFAISAKLENAMSNISRVIHDRARTNCLGFKIVGLTKC